MPSASETTAATVSRIWPCQRPHGLREEPIRRSRTHQDLVLERDPHELQQRLARSFRQIVPPVHCPPLLKIRLELRSGATGRLPPAPRRTCALGRLVTQPCLRI